MKLGAVSLAHGCLRGNALPYECLEALYRKMAACIQELAKLMQVSNTEAVNLLRQVLAMRNKTGKEAGELQQEGSDPMVSEDLPSSSASPIADLPTSATPDLLPTAELAATDPTIESTEANKAAMKPFSYRLDRLDPEPVQIQAGCTAVVAVFQARRRKLWEMVNCKGLHALLLTFSNLLKFLETQGL